jgi:hypothetical protein
MHEFLLETGNVREPREFGVQMVKRIYRLIPYDQARVYFLDATGRICDEFLVGVEQIWSDIYREHYAGMDDGRYAIPARRHSLLTRTVKGRHSIPKIQGSVYDWIDSVLDFCSDIT